MVDAIKLESLVRDEFGKGAARRLRRDGRVPAVLYGHGTETVHLALPGHETLLALRTANALLEISYDGQEQLALPRQVQRDPIRGDIEHVDLLLVKRGEKVVVEVPLSIQGDAAPDTLVVVDLQSLLVEAPAIAIPDELVVSVEGLEIGAQVFAKDLDLPKDVTLAGDPEEMILSVNPPVVQDLGEEPEAAEGEAKEAAAPDAE